jgi:putative sigma-54 modulation protein
MKTTVKARNFDLSSRLHQQIDRKLRRLDRIAHPESEANVELISKASHSNDASHVAEVTLVLNGSVVRSASSGANPIAALDTVLDKLERQVIREKEKPRSVRDRSNPEVVRVLKREASGTIAGADEADEAEATPAPAVVETKRFDMLPMFTEDAITQMEELGHAFFVFLNAETDSVCVVYRRKDGAYGLIAPVVKRGRR